MFFNDKEKLILLMYLNKEWLLVCLNISNIRINKWIMNMNMSMNTIFLYSWMNTKMNKYFLINTIWMSIFMNDYEYFCIVSHSALPALARLPIS